MARPPILTLSDIGLSFGQTPVFDGLNLVVHQGDRLCLVGRNGSGKSTLMKTIACLIEPDRGHRFIQPGMAISYLEQDPDMSGFETLRDFALSKIPHDEGYKLDILADGMRLDLSRDPSVASGGEKRRSALVACLATDAELLLLDEPTNHLDILAVQWLEAHLRATKQAYILISHDRAFLRNLTRGIVWVDRGQVRQHPKGFEAFEDWRDKTFEEEDTARHKQKRLIKAEARWAVEGISGRRKRNQGRLRRLQDLRQDRAGHIKRKGAAAMDLAEADISGKKVIEAFNVSKSFTDAPIVDQFDLKIQRGDRLALVGPNGVGKTTLIRLLMGELKPDTGSVKLGTNLVPVYFDQNREDLIADTSLWNNLVNDPALGVIGKSDHVMVRGQPRHVMGYLKDFLFDEAQARGPISKLSGGERARLILAKLMAKESNLLVLDEPTNDLDIETLDLLQELLDDYQGTVILVSHDRDFIDRIATQSILLEGNGRHTIYAGGWSDVLLQGGGIAAVEPEATQKRAKPKTTNEAPKSSMQQLSFTEKHRLEELPDVIDRLNAEIEKLEVFLSTPNLFTDAPVKFQKATDGLVDRQNRLSLAEEEWLMLMERSDL
ncbi:MAG: ATP-binding cassette domain-containing protein [Pseudomonadota bacterium]